MDGAGVRLRLEAHAAPDNNVFQARDVGRGCPSIAEPVEPYAAWRELDENGWQKPVKSSLEES